VTIKTLQSYNWNFKVFREILGLSSSTTIFEELDNHKTDL